MKAAGVWEVRMIQMTLKQVLAALGLAENRNEVRYKRLYRDLYKDIIHSFVTPLLLFMLILSSIFTYAILPSLY